MKQLLEEIKIAAKQAPRLYFAPFIGAYQAMKKEALAMRHSRGAMRSATAKDQKKMAA